MNTQNTGRAGSSRQTLAYVLFVLAVALLVFSLVTDLGVIGVAGALVVALGGYFFFRRGRAAS